MKCLAKHVTLAYGFSVFLTKGIITINFLENNLSNSSNIYKNHVSEISVHNRLWIFLIKLLNSSILLPFKSLFSLKFKFKSSKKYKFYNDLQIYFMQNILQFFNFKVSFFKLHWFSIIKDSYNISSLFKSVFDKLSDKKLY